MEIIVKTKKSMKTIVALLTLMCVATTAYSQTFTERLQKVVAGKGVIKVVHSATIDKLVNGNQPDLRPAKPQTTTPAQKTAETTKTQQTQTDPTRKTTMRARKSAIGTRCES